MSIELVDFSSRAFSSSGEKTTYFPFSNSLPFTISSRSTTLLSCLGQTYCCLSLVHHSFWSMLNEIEAEDSPVEYNSTGTVTRPKEIVAVLMERAGISVSEARNQVASKIHG